MITINYTATLMVKIASPGKIYAYKVSTYVQNLWLFWRIFKKSTLTKTSEPGGKYNFCLQTIYLCMTTAWPSSTRF